MIWTPFTDTGELAPGLTITGTTAGSCSSPAQASSRPESLRCFGADNYVYDPCWRHDTWEIQPALVVCGFPGDTRLKRVVPTGAVPSAATRSPGDPTATDPASIVLADGQRCSFQEGAGAPEVNGERANYACPRGTAYGYPDRTTAAWRIRYRSTADSGLTQVPITTAYF